VNVTGACHPEDVRDRECKVMLALTTFCGRFKCIKYLLAIDLNDETSCRKPLLSAVELGRTFGTRLHALSVVREVEALLQAKTAPLGYDLIAADLENRIAALIRRVDASDLKPDILVSHGVSIWVRSEYRCAGRNDHRNWRATATRAA
jgi:hypothetical protein